MLEKTLLALQAQRTPSPKRMYRRGRPVCRFCGDDLDAVARRRGACDDPVCRKKERALRDTLRRERDEIELTAMRAAAALALQQEHMLVRQLRDQAAPEMTALEPASPALKVEDIAVTCHIATPLVDLDPALVADFRSRFEALARSLFEKEDADRARGLEARAEDDGVTRQEDGALLIDLMFRTFAERSTLEAPVHAAENATCAACRGRCCDGGFRNLAYIRPSDVARFRQRNPGATPQGMADAFLAHLPETHVRDSCLFHGPQGCTIPRSMRTNLCLGYKCHWLLNISEMVARGSPPRLVAGFEDHRPRKAFLVTEDGGLVESPVDSSISADVLMAEAEAVARGAPTRKEEDQTPLPESPELRAS